MFTLSANCSKNKGIFCMYVHMNSLLYIYIYIYRCHFAERGNRQLATILNLEATLYTLNCPICQFHQDGLSYDRIHYGISTLLHAAQQNQRMLRIRSVAHTPRNTDRDTDTDKVCRLVESPAWRLITNQFHGNPTRGQGQPMS